MQEEALITEKKACDCLVINNKELEAAFLSYIKKTKYLERIRLKSHTRLSYSTGTGHKEATLSGCSSKRKAFLCEWH